MTGFIVNYWYNFFFLSYLKKYVNKHSLSRLSIIYSKYMFCIRSELITTVTRICLSKIKNSEVCSLLTFPNHTLCTLNRSLISAARCCRDLRQIALPNKNVITYKLFYRVTTDFPRNVTVFNNFPWMLYAREWCI